MKRILYCIIPLLIILYAVRVFILNSNDVRPLEINYEFGEKVGFENDFFGTSNECSNGYYITIIGTDLLTIDEFVQKYNESNSECYEGYEYMYLIHAKFSNDSNMEGMNAGINLSRYILQDQSYISFMSREAYCAINDIDIYSFSLRLETEEELIIPYGIDLDYVDINEIATGKASLVISAYPHKKMISLS